MVKRVRSSSSGTGKKYIKREEGRGRSLFIDDEAEEAGETENEEGEVEDDDGALSEHSTFSMLERARMAGKDKEGDDDEVREPSTDVRVEVAPVDAAAVPTAKSEVTAVDEASRSTADDGTAAAKANIVKPAGNAKGDNQTSSSNSSFPEAGTPWIQGRPRLNARIDRMHDFANDAELTYSVLRVPGDARVVACDDPVRDRVHLLGRPLPSRPQTTAPLTIWLVGRLTRVYLRDGSGNLPKSVSVNVKLLSARSFHAATTLLRRFSTDAAGVEQYDDVRASRWMTVKAPGEFMDRTDSFDAVWDARKALKSPRDKMEPVFATDLKKGDLVLVEVNLARYRVTDKSSGADSSSPNKNRKRRENWAAYYSLKSICVLDDTPVQTDPDTIVPVQNWEL